VVRRLRFASLMLFWFGFVVGAQAQSAPARPALAQADGAVPITLGQSVVPLYGPWKFTFGDSPIDPATREPLWAEPGFDDSAWETVDLTPAKGAIDPISGQTEYVPGWTARGHAGHWGYAWYRIRVRVEGQSGDKLALAGPADVDDAYQSFDNGKLVGSFGDFSGSRPMFYFSQPMMFPLAQPGSGSAGETTRVLSFRVWMHPDTLLQNDEAGGFHTAPLLGEMEAVAAQHQMRQDGLERAYAGVLIEAVVFTLLGLVALSLALFDRSDPVYLWIGALLLLIATYRYCSVISALTLHISANTSLVAQQVFFSALVSAGWVMVWRVWFRLRSQAWIPRILPILVVLLMVSNSLYQNLFFTFVPLPVSHAFEPVSVAIRVVVVLLMLITVFQGIRQRGLEGWVALPAVLLAAISEFYAELQFLHILEFWFPFGVQITMRQLANLMLVAVLAVLLLRRLLLSIREQRRMALDVKQAQEVQQVILPQARTVLSGLVVESEYHPARDVGGDFFQIIPHKTDGSLLIVVGDVAGKGLKAGMLVALLVGAIRSTAEWNAQPEFVLNALNRRLLGRGDAQATCLALSIGSDGVVTLANAGHIPPYLNGDPIAIEGALPLGVIEGAEFSFLQFQLMDDDTLVMMSDGIAEATDVEGHLFGFERVHELLRTAGSAAEVANAAQRFGQEDDISVITVTRTAVLEPASA
jgi:serine phosphatase RsbU (regulator of sigma subunit)